jgi:hypothetical protein
MRLIELKPMISRSSNDGSLDAALVPPSSGGGQVAHRGGSVYPGSCVLPSPRTGIVKAHRSARANSFLFMVFPFNLR